MIYEIPDELCGVAGCVFLKDHKGKHTWEVNSGERRIS